VLSLEDNALLTRIGPGTPMGDLLRQYWIPALFSTELPRADSDPVRVRLLAEDLVAFRDSNGAVGILANNCPHRGASLFFGRNEEAGLRCVYHGWKFAVDGTCIDMPNEPAESDFRTKVKAAAYPTHQLNGVVWVFMGQAPEPPLPDLEWNLLPEGHVYLTKRVADSNWVQTLEGEIDSSHSGFLHTLLEEQDNYVNAPIASNARLYGTSSKGMYYKMKDRHPHFEVLDTEYGVLIGARREAEADSFYWRLTQFLMPFHTIIPPYGEDPVFSGHAWIPIDDHHTLALCFTYHPVRPLSDDEVSRLRHGGGKLGHQGLHPTIDAFLPPTTEAWSQYRSIYNKANDYQLDADAQRTVRYSGLPGVWPQDSACQESMGEVCDRTAEHLGSSDSGIIRARRRLMNAARALREQGTPAPGATQPGAYRIRSASVVLPRAGSWIDDSAPFREARPGENVAAV
jgi:phthalate 4,5-dioxygenase oxygenase subunit